MSYEVMLRIKGNHVFDRDTLNSAIEHLTGIPDYCGEDNKHLEFTEYNPKTDETIVYCEVTE